MIQNLKGIVYPMTDTSTEIIDNGSDNGQNDDATTGLDAEDNQQTSQQDSLCVYQLIEHIVQPVLTPLYFILDSRD